MRPRWTTLLPPEHGSWAFLLLPVSVGLLRRPSLGGAALGLAALCAFLLRVPMERRGGPRRHPDAEAWIRLLRPLGELSALLAMFLACGHPVIVAGLGLGLVASLIGLEPVKVRRSAAWELGGAAGLSLLAPALLRLGGAPMGEAALVWAFLVLFTLPPLLYLRQRLDRAGDPYRVSASLMAHGAALLIALTAFRLAWAPFAFLLWMALLAARAAWGATRARIAGGGKRLGIFEACVGGVHLALLAAWGRL